MNKKDIFNSIDEKLTPSMQAERELFEKASKMKAGDKFMGDTERIFLSKGISPDDIGEEKSAPATLRSRRMTIAAAAAALALVIGGGAFFGLYSHKGVVTESTASSQKAEENKTEKEKITLAEPAAIELDKDRPWETLGLLLDKCYDDYVSSGKNYLKLAESPTFIGLLQLDYAELHRYLIDMYQNKEIKGRRIFIAENLMDFWSGLETYDVAALQSDLSAYEYFGMMYDEFDRNELKYGGIEQELLDYKAGKEYKGTQYVQDIKYAALFHKLDRQNYKTQKEYSLLYKALIEEIYPNHLICVPEMYSLGLIDDDELEIAYQMRKDKGFELDYEALMYDLLVPEDEVRDSYGWYINAEEWLTGTDDEDEWLILKLKRIAAAQADNDDYNMDEDVNYKSLCKLGSFSLQRAILSDKESGRLSNTGAEYYTATLVMDKQGINDYLPYNTNDSEINDNDVSASEAYNTYMHAAFVCGAYKEQYGESPRIDDFTLTLDRVLDGLGMLKDAHERAGLEEYECAEVLTDEQVLKIRESAEVYLDIFDLDGNVLHIIAPKVKGSTLIIGNFEYDGVDDETMAQISSAIHKYVNVSDIGRESIKPDTVKYQRPEQADVYDTVSAQKLYMYARYISARYFSNCDDPKEVLKNSKDGSPLYAEIKIDKGSLTICIPDEEGTQVVVSNELGVNFNCKNVDNELVKKIAAFMKQDIKNSKN